jgi:hypothetical protein
MSLCVLVVSELLELDFSSSSPQAAAKIARAEAAPVPPTILRKRRRESTSSVNSLTAPLSSAIEALRSECGMSGASTRPGGGRMPY